MLITFQLIIKTVKINNSPFDRNNKISINIVNISIIFSSRNYKRDFMDDILLAITHNIVHIEPLHIIPKYFTACVNLIIIGKSFNQP
jgi:hypothetical protein